MAAESPQISENKRRDYFYRLGLETRPAIKLHRQQGLLGKVIQETFEGPKLVRDWGNVTEHCLVEAARVKVFAEILSFSPDLTYDLIQAAAMHDFFKKGEKQIASADNFSWDSYVKAAEEAERVMVKAGVPERQRALVNSVGSSSLLETQRILAKDVKTDFDLAYLVMHYVDDYTIDNQWVSENETINGRVISDLDRRMDRSEVNPRYHRLNLEGREFFNGETAIEAQRRIGHEIEIVLAREAELRSWVLLDPLRLPEYIDGQIFVDIEG